MSAGEECPPLVISEVTSAGEFFEFDGNTFDWVELHNAGGTPIDASGWGLDGPNAAHVEAGPLPATWPAVAADSSFAFPDGWPELGPGARVLLVASTYSMSNGAFSLLFDLNNDGASVDLYGPDDVRCQHVAVPDIHAGYSWSLQEEADPPHWCDTRPSPGWENERCVCDLSTGC